MGEELVVARVQCPMCGKSYGVDVPRIGLNKWRGGTLIQNALPYLSAEARESLQSGYCLDCQDIVFREAPEC